MASADSDRAMGDEFRLRGNPRSMARVTRGNFISSRIFTLVTGGSADPIDAGPRFSTEGLGRRDVAPAARAKGMRTAVHETIEGARPGACRIDTPPPACHQCRVCDRCSKSTSRRAIPSVRSRKTQTISPVQRISVAVRRSPEVIHGVAVVRRLRGFAARQRPTPTTTPCASAVLIRGTPPAPRERTAS